MINYKGENPILTVSNVMDYTWNKFGSKLVLRKSNTEKWAPSYVLFDSKLGVFVNGKGASDEYAQASACGEYIERLFNRSFF